MGILHKNQQIKKVLDYMSDMTSPGECTTNIEPP